MRPIPQGEDAEPICRELRRKWRIRQTEGLNSFDED